MPSRNFALIFIPLAAAFAQPAPADRAEALLRQMTLDEKIGQLTQLAGLPLIPDPVKIDDRVRKGQGGSILWLSDPASINRLQKIAVEETRLKIPALFGLDVIHGFRTVFPVPFAMAASWDMDLIEKGQQIAARESRAAGIQWTFAPMLDIARDARWGRIVEGAGEDPVLGAAVARAQIRGFQGDHLSSAADRMLACAKHFAGYGAADGGRDYDSAYIPDVLLWNVYFPPFKAALDAGAGTFMSAYMDLNDVPATGNAFLLRDVLRKIWGFKGFVVSDAFAVRDLQTHGFASSPQDSAQRALLAGVDMDMGSRTYLENLAAAVKSGKVPMSVIDDSVRSILKVKFEMGLFEHPYGDAALLAKVSRAPEHLKLAREAAQRSAVLLRNEGGLLPLKANAGQKIALIGPLGDSVFDTLGSWQAMGQTLDAVTLAQGLKARGVTVEVVKGVQLRKQIPSMFDQLMGGKPETPWTEAQAGEAFTDAVEAARRADVVVLALGELALMSGELASRSSLNLPGRQQQLMEAVVATGKPVVLVLFSGRPVNIGWAASHVPAILEAWYPGSEGGNAIADLLYGDASPGGKLPVTWPRSVGQEPLFLESNLTHQPEGSQMFSSRYWDQPGTPQYPFGYGLSYTTFEYTNLHIAGSGRVSVDVRNTGSRPGVEVTQLYIHQRAGGASRPKRELKGFARVQLEPGEKRSLEFPLGEEQLRYWNPVSKKWIFEKHEQFDVWAGGDSRGMLHTLYRP
ncbi:MAG TPA: beta-glucosidase BglX [Bryobacteraceae bacterium]|jgi:beta-glucosidase